MTSFGLSMGMPRPLTSTGWGGGGGGVSIVNNGVLAPFVTFTRASTATYFDSAGVMQTAAIDEPRVDYDPDTLELRGLLIEPQRTNLLLNSATLSTQSVTVTATVHTLSFYGTGTVTLSGASTAGPLVGTGANNRVTLTFTPTAGSLTLTVSGSVTLAQLEAGDFATSYIPTAGTAVTRAADSATVTSLSSIRYNEDEGTIVTEYSAPPHDGVVYPGVMSLHNSGDTTTNYIQIFASASTKILRVGMRSSGGNTEVTTLTGYLPGAVYRTAVAYRDADSAGCTNGANPVAIGLSPLPTGVNTMSIGTRLGNTSGQVVLCGHIRHLRYYPRRLSNAQLQAITA